jgi:DmsE family decaheme c-type cytochrome
MKLLKVIALLCAFMGIGGLSSVFAATPAETAAKGLKENATCTRCHDESETLPILSIYQTAHGVRADERTPSCQSCHGESTKHLGGNVEGKGRPSPDIIFVKHNFPLSAANDRADKCITCHNGTARSHWEGSQHQVNDVACNDCHKVHQAKDAVREKKTQQDVCFACHKEQRAQTHRISTHPLAAGKMACSDCHNPHGSTGPKLLIKNSINETCYTCHAEKRGPFLWEHSSATDDCSNCHTPHGSTNTPLLKARVPWLCQECHSGDHGNQVNSGANLYNGNVSTVNGLQANGNVSGRAQMNARACLNCHLLVHGSNHPAGAKFQR